MARRAPAKVILSKDFERTSRIAKRYATHQARIAAANHRMKIPSIEIHCNWDTKVNLDKQTADAKGTRRRLRQPAPQVTRPWKLPSTDVRPWRLRCGSPCGRSRACRGSSW